MLARDFVVFEGIGGHDKNAAMDRHERDGR
jgi:hypothetical protein